MAADKDNWYKRVAKNANSIMMAKAVSEQDPEEPEGFDLEHEDALWREDFFCWKGCQRFHGKIWKRF